MTHLNEWRDRIGHAKAQQITTEAAGVGTAMHANLERFVVGEQRQPGNAPVHVQANKMADVIIENGLSKVSEVWAMEQSLYFPGLFSGTTDLVGVHDGEPAVMDHKQTNKPKKAEWVETAGSSFVAELLITGMDDMGVILRLSNVIANKLKVNMRSFSMTGGEGHFEGRISVEVNSKEQLNLVINELKLLEEVNTVARIV
jgi:predicted amino acid-binding ACT domain protein